MGWKKLTLLLWRPLFLCCERGRDMHTQREFKRKLCVSNYKLLSDIFSSDKNRLIIFIFCKQSEHKHDENRDFFWHYATALVRDTFICKLKEICMPNKKCNNTEP